MTIPKPTTEVSEDTNSIEKPSNIFRQEALDWQSSPEQLDQSMRLVRPQDWLILTGFGTMVVLSVLWGIFGRIPITVSGRGVLVRPQQLVELQSKIPGRLQSLKVSNGQCVEKDEVLAVINPTQLKQQLQLQQANLSQLESKAAAAKQQQQQRTKMESDAISAKGNILRKRLENARKLATQVRRRRGNLEYLESQDKIYQIETELQELAIYQKRLERDNIEGQKQRQNEIDEVRREISALEKQIADNSNIVSSQPGCVLEIKAVVGQYINTDKPLATITTLDKSKEMVAVTYLNIADSKRVKPGMEIQIAPDLAKGQSMGYLLGKITAVSEFPVTKEGASLVVGNSELVENIMGRDGGKIEVIARLEPDENTPSGYRWSSSSEPELDITSGMTTTSKVTIEERRPIAFVLPFISEWGKID